ncbi:hypothetical protein Tco_1249008 [Tanacetum coccineum]
MGRDTIQLEDVVSTISGEYLMEFTSEYGIPKDLHLSCLAPRIPSLIFLRAKSVDERVFLTVVAWRTGAPKDGMPAADSYSALDVVTLNTRRTPIQKQPELLLCLVGLKYTNNLCVNAEMDLFNLISAPNPTKVKTGTRPRAAHEVPLLTATSNCVIDMEDVTGTSKSLGTPSVIEKSPLDFSNEDPPPAITERGRIEDQVQAEVSNEAPSVENPQTMGVVPIPDLEHEAGAMGSLVRKKCRKRGNDKANANAPPKSPDHQDPRWSYGYNRGTRLVTCGDSGVKEIHVARRNERIHVKDEEIKRLGEEVESLKAVETEVHGLRKQTKNLKTLLEAEAAFKEFKKYEDDRVEKHCAEMDACLDAMSIDFDEELYPHMLTAIAGRRCVIGHDLRLAVMKCAESIELRQTFANVVSAGIAKGMSKGLEYGVKQGDAKLDLAAIEAYDVEADDKTSPPYMP